LGVASIGYDDFLFFSNSKMKHTSKLTLLAALLAASAGAMAADWSSDTIGYSYSPNGTEPGIAQDVSKNIFTYTHVDGSKSGSNLFSFEYLKSDSTDPTTFGGSDGASEFYGFYQRSQSLSYMIGRTGGFGFAKDLNLVARVGLGTKNTQFAPSPVKLALGVSADMPVTGGFWTVGVNVYKEVHHNGITNQNVSFDPALQLTTAWSVPVGSFSFNGFGYIIGPKGKDGFGGDTKTETRIRGTLMHKLGDTNFSAGVGVEYWDNKFGADQSTTPGSTGTTALVLLEYKL
jgi:hypothetical protein